MSTARELIYDAMTAVGILGQGDVAPSAADAAVGLRKLQRMLDSWSVDGPMVYAITQETITLTAADGTYATTDLSTNTRPVAVEGGFIRYSGTDYPLTLITRAQWNSIGVKTTQGVPELLFYDPTMTAGAFEFYPVPSASMTAYINCRRVLASGLTLDTSFSLPPGYEKAIVDNLAVDLAAGGFGAQASPLLMMEAANAKRLLETLNWRPPVMDSMFAGEVEYDIRSGT